MQAWGLEFRCQYTCKISDMDGWMLMACNPNVVGRTDTVGLLRLVGYQPSYRFSERPPPQGNKVESHAAGCLDSYCDIWARAQTCLPTCVTSVHIPHAIGRERSLDDWNHAVIL